MPRYHLHIRNGHGLTPDEEGRELADEAAARDEALKGIRSIAAEEVREGRLDLAGRIDVTDADGRLLFSIPFEEAVRVQGGE